MTDEEGDLVVTVLPITHTLPADPPLGLEIPHVTKKRLGLDDERSWVVLTEANRFTWPEPDLCMARHGDAASVVYGELPGRFLLQIRDRFMAAIQAGIASVVRRTQ